MNVRIIALSLAIAVGLVAQQAQDARSQTTEEMAAACSQAKGARPT